MKKLFTVSDVDGSKISIDKHTGITNMRMLAILTEMLDGVILSYPGDRNDILAAVIGLLSRKG